MDGFVVFRLYKDLRYINDLGMWHMWCKMYCSAKTESSCITDSSASKLKMFFGLVVAMYCMAFNVPTEMLGVLRQWEHSVIPSSTEK